MILPPNVNVQLIDPQTGKATSFFTKFLASVAANFGTSISVPWTPGAINPGVSANLAVPVPGAAVGQPVTASYSQPVVGIQPVAQVIAAGNVEVGLLNMTAGALTPLAGTITVTVWTA